MTQPFSRTTGRRAFAALELLVMLAVLALLAATLLPALAWSGSDVQKINCLNSKRQLCLAWQMYNGDNNDNLVTTLHGGSAQGAVGDPKLGVGWCSGWLDQGISSDNTNILFLVNPKYAKLAPYINQLTNLFKCPADRYLSAAQRAQGWSQRVRSVSLSVGIGEGNAEAGPWDPIYKHAKKFTDLLYPTPAETFLFLDEDPYSINDPAFFSPFKTSWVDIPASYHYGGAGFGFADSHAEIHNWTGTLPHVTTNLFADLHWLSYHSTRGSTKSY
jgi:type II secretory pathway pseudopilin PulG